MEIKEFFEPVLNVIKNFQKKEKEPGSKQAAKDRLKLLLMQDRASVSPDFFDMMKQEIIDVIKKYIEIDEESLEVELARGFEAGLEGPALYANIPIKNVKPVAPKVETSPALSEEEADELADQILDNIEKASESETAEDSANATLETSTDVTDISEESVLEEPDLEDENPNDVAFDESVSEEEPIVDSSKKKVTTRKKATTSSKSTKATASKKQSPKKKA